MATFTVDENYGSYKGDPSYIIDGSTSQTWRANEQESTGKYVLVTASEPIHINTITYTTGQSDEIFSSSYLQVSTDGSTWVDVGQFNKTSPLTFNVNRVAQYIRIYCKSGSSQYVSISELAIDYASSTTYRITTQVGDGITIDKPMEDEVSGGEYVLTITPGNGVTISTATDNGTDILGQLQEKTPSQGGTVTSFPKAYSTSGNISGTRYKNCIGKGSSTTATGNDYASGSSSATAVITYTFDLSEIPSNATIDSVTVKVGGHAENASKSTATLQLYSGSVAKGSSGKFTQTSKQIVTLSGGTWTRDELQNAQLKFTIGYYGGLINGVDFEVAYSMQTGGGTYYTYTIASVAEDHVILINMGGDVGTKARVKIGGTYKKVLKIMQKQNGRYVVVDNIPGNPGLLIKL